VVTSESTQSSESSQVAAQKRGQRKKRIGIVTSARMDKTVVVAVQRTLRHPKYGKIVKRTKKYYAHDENNEAREGDRVLIAETRPLSKLKRWRVAEILERAR
jgi:small subunit ribosomal protein S17